MPFVKEHGAERSYTGLNRIKGHWNKQIDDINTTPILRDYAIKKLEYLSAETPKEKVMSQLALLAYYATKIGYKIDPSVIVLDEPELDKLAQDMLNHALGKQV